MLSQENILSRLLHLECRIDIPLRKEFLALAAEIVGENCVFLFWASDHKQGRYFLDSVYDSELRLGPIELLSAISIETLESVKGSGHLNRATRDRIPELAKLAFRYELILPVELHDSESKGNLDETRHIGFLQLICGRKVTREQEQSLISLSYALAAAVMRWRKRRELLALRKMLTDVNLLKPTDNWLQTCATVLQSITDAKMCVVFKAARESTVKAVAVAPGGRQIGELIATPTSLLRRCLQSPEVLRIADFRDAAERLRVTGTSEYDSALEAKISAHLGENVRSFLAAPVMSEGHVLSVVALFNKTGYLPQQFTETDLSILDSVCRFLAGVIPSVEMTLTMERLSTTVSAVNFEDENQRSNLFATLCQTLPSVTGAMLGLKNYGSEEFGTVYFGGDSKRFVGETFALNNTPRYIDAKSPQSYRLCIEIPGLVNKSARLTLLLSDASLSKQENRALHFFITQLTQKLRAEEIIEGAIRNLVETRHAIRSGLNGLGHIEEASTCFEIIASHNFLPSEVLLRRAYKAIKRTQMFAEKTRILMEESRYLLIDVSPGSLRIAEYSLVKVVHNVNLCLAPDAEEKRIIVDIDNRIQPAFDLMHNDPLLIEIAIFNLLDNAIKYSLREHHVTVKLFLRADKWVVSISNVGPWIPERDRDAIFLPFERRVSGAWASTTTGTGVGLAVVKKIVSAHNGVTELSSTPQSERSKSPADTIFIISVPRNTTHSK